MSSHKRVIIPKWPFSGKVQWYSEVKCMITGQE